MIELALALCIAVLKERTEANRDTQMQVLAYSVLEEFVSAKMPSGAFIDLGLMVYLIGRIQDEDDFSETELISEVNAHVNRSLL